VTGASTLVEDGLITQTYLDELSISVIVTMEAAPVMLVVGHTLDRGRTPWRAGSRR
jgi:hypothetical protein